METLNYLLGLTELHYLAMGISVLIILGALYWFWMEMAAMAIVTVIVSSWSNLVTLTIFFVPSVSFVCLLFYEIYLIRSGSFVKGFKKLSIALLLNVIALLGAIGAFGYAKEVRTKEVKELLPVCKTSNLEEIKKTGKGDDFVENCEKALKYEKEHLIK